MNERVIDKQVQISIPNSRRKIRFSGFGDDRESLAVGCEAQPFSSTLRTLGKHHVLAIQEDRIVFSILFNAKADTAS